MNYPIFQLAWLESAPRDAQLSNRWFIVETYWTSDGPRTRVCDGGYLTEDEAKESKRKREERN